MALYSASLRRGAHRGPTSRHQIGEWHVRAASVADSRALAPRLPPNIFFEYIDGGSYAEVTLKRNIADLEAIALRQRVLNDVSRLVLTTRLFGQEWILPVAPARNAPPRINPPPRRGPAGARHQRRRHPLLPLHRLGLSARRGRARRE